MRVRTVTELTVDTPGAAQHLKLSVSHLEKMRVYGTGPSYVKLGRAVRYRISDLEAYLSARVVVPNGGAN